HQLAGHLAIAEKKNGLAESEFAAALQLAPDNQQLALNLATIRLTLADSPAREKARAELERLVEQNALRLEALRALTMDALANKSDAAEKWAAQLRVEKGATFSDLLLYLDATQKTDAAPTALHDAETEATRSPGVAAALITWMNRHGMAKPALEWALALPMGILNGPPVPLAVGEAYSFLQDWNGLHAWVDE